ncbi:unnamed protein product, partial [Pylaiella littoralis]
MTLISLRWSSASSQVCRVTDSAAAAADTSRPRLMSKTTPPASRQEKPLGMSTSRWRLAKSICVSGSKPAFSPNPPPQLQLQGGCQAHQSVDQQDSAGSRSNDVSRGPAVVDSTTGTKARNILNVPALPLNVERQNQVSYVPSEQDATSSTVKVEATAREKKNTAEVGGNGSGGIVLRRLLTDGCSDLGQDEALPRSGSAPSPLAMPLANFSGTDFSPSRQPADAGWALLGGRSKVDCSPFKPEESLAQATRSCWDERKDATGVSVDAVTPPQDGAASTGPTSKVASEAELKQPSLKRLILPPLSSEQGLSCTGVGKKKPSLVPWRQRKFVGRNGFRGGSSTTSSKHNKTASACHESSLVKNKSSAPSLRTPETSRPSTTSSTNTACEAAPSSSGVYQGPLKARLRVMEWKRRQSEELKTQQEEQATLEQKNKLEANTEAARKLAAARAEEVERRFILERESTADALRAGEAAEKWAKTSRQRQQRRAEIYAINALMRTAFEREFEAYSLERAGRTTQAAA